MTQTVRGILDNFAYIVNYHGFIPNSGNIQQVFTKFKIFYYYRKLLIANFRLSRRSQPPLFTQMVFDYYNATKDLEYLRNKMPVIEKEIQFWRRNRTVQAPERENLTLYQYRVSNLEPVV